MRISLLHRTSNSKNFTQISSENCRSHYFSYQCNMSQSDCRLPTVALCRRAMRLPPQLIVHGYWTQILVLLAQMQPAYTNKH